MYQMITHSLTPSEGEQSASEATFESKTGTEYDEEDVTTHNDYGSRK